MVVYVVFCVFQKPYYCPNGCEYLLIAGLFQAAFLVGYTHRRVNWNDANRQLQYILDLDVKGSRVMANGPFTKEELRAAEDNAIRKETTETFLLGQKSQTDLLNLGKEIYKHDLPKWGNSPHPGG